SQRLYDYFVLQKATAILGIPFLLINEGVYDILVYLHLSLIDHLPLVFGILSQDYGSLWDVSKNRHHTQFVWPPSMIRYPFPSINNLVHLFAMHVLHNFHHHESII